MTDGTDGVVIDHEFAFFGPLGPASPVGVKVIQTPLRIFHT
jgi:hypothetical protein